jgi:hypothetical protein
MSAHRSTSRIILTTAGLLAVALLATVLLLPLRRTARTDIAKASPPAEWRSKIKEPETPPGGWNTARGQVLTQEQRSELERLESLGYLASGARATAHEGVTVHDESRSQAGLNLYVSGDSPGAKLMDMDGNVLHEWRFPFLDAWPERHREDETVRGARFWFHAHVFENGDIIGVFNSLGVVKLDRNSNLIWKYAGGCHHHLHVADDGRIYVIGQELKLDERVSNRTDMIDDLLTVLDADGSELSRVSLLEAFWNSDYASWLESGVVNRGRRIIDVFHANRVVPLDNRFSDRIPSFREGNVLLSLRNLNALVVLDAESERIVWSQSGMWLQQHCPSVMDDGDILLFDNQGNYGSSRILEYDPVTQEITWEYSGDGEGDFYSEKYGTVQRLPNGNTLIAESHFGRALEVTPAGDIVWEFYNPARAGENNEFVANLFGIERLPADFPTDWLD